jgi:antitoxin component YwqK of YwqJK toxin-antitoxin module
VYKAFKLFKENSMDDNVFYQSSIKEIFSDQDALAMSGDIFKIKQVLPFTYEKRLLPNKIIDYKFIKEPILYESLIYEKENIVYTKSDNLVFSGIVEVKNVDENIIRQSVFKNGVHHGVSKYYYASGELESCCLWLDGKIEGLYIYFEKNGEFKSVDIYKNGELKDILNNP